MFAKRTSPVPSPAPLIPIVVDPAATAPPEGNGNFNIVRMVQEHGPIRLKAIEDELNKMNRRRDQLLAEAAKIDKLLKATQE